MLTAFSRTAIRTVAVLLAGGGLTACLQAGDPGYCAMHSSCAHTGSFCSPTRATLIAPTMDYYVNSYRYGLPYGATSSVGYSSKTVVVYSANPTVNVYSSVDPTLSSNFYPQTYGYPYVPSQMQMSSQWPLANPTAGNLFANPYLSNPYPTNYGAYPNYAMGNYPNSTFQPGSNANYPYPTTSFTPTFGVPQQYPGAMNPAMNNYYVQPQQYPTPMNPAMNNYYVPPQQYPTPVSPTFNNSNPYLYSPGSYPVSTVSAYGAIPGTPVSAAFDTFPR